MTAVYLFLGMAAGCFLFAVLAFSWRDTKISLTHITEAKGDEVERRYNKWQKRQRVAVIIGIVCIVIAVVLVIVPHWDDIQRNLHKSQTETIESIT